MRTRIAALDGLRGLACLAVTSNHVGVPGAAGGWIGVDIFFVLSGLLITQLLVAERERTGSIWLRSFYVRRAARLYPALLVTIAASLALSPLVAPAQDVALGAILAGSYLMNLWPLIHWTHGPDLLWHTWSLAVEEHFYLLWPLVFIRARTPRRALRFAVAALVVSMALMAVTPGRHDGVSFAYFFTTGRAWELLAGCSLALAAPVVSRRLASTAGWGGSGLLLVALAIGALTGRSNPLWLTLTCAVSTLGTVFILTAIQHQDVFPVRMVALKPLAWVGERSYGLYLYQLPILFLTMRFLHIRRGLIGVAVLGVSLVAAWASKRWIEDPVRHFAQHWSSRAGDRVEPPERQPGQSVALLGQPLDLPDGLRVRRVTPGWTSN